MEEDLLLKYKHLRPAIVALLPLIQRAQNGLELEARFGCITANGFVAGVTEEFFESTLALLRQFNGHWHENSGFFEVADFFYVVNGDTVRTRVAADGRGGSTTCHMKKKSVAKCDIPVLVAHANVDLSVRLPDIRVSLASEQEVGTINLPQFIRPSRVTIGERTSFLYGRISHEPGLWQFDLSRRWSGATKVEAERARSNSPPVLEVELECLSPTSYMNSLGPHYAAHESYRQHFLACSLLLKMADLFGSISFQLLAAHAEDPENEPDRAESIRESALKLLNSLK